jgi:hypothetical protein
MTKAGWIARCGNNIEVVTENKKSENLEILVKINTNKNGMYLEYPDSS